MEHLRCVIERITFQSAETGFSVLKCKAKNFPDLVTVVGIMPETHVGSVLSLEGFWKVDKKYGKQFSVKKWEETLPATIYGIEKYLGSGLVKGVGPKFARKIVEKFGKDTLDVIEESPDDLLKVEGIGKIRVQRIKTSWQEQKEIKNIMLFLQSHNVSTSHATKIFKTYGSDSIDVVKENPYRLADDIWGIGFKTADSIAEKMGLEKDSFVRIRSGILFSLNQLAENGHCYAEREQLLGTAEKLLEIDNPEIVITLEEMLRTEDLIRDGDAIYLPPFYFAEAGLARKIKELMAAPRQIVLDIDISEIGTEGDIEYDDIQLQAIKTAVSEKVMIMTGGPGTGKTTTTMGIISAYKRAGCNIILAAPTGRAAKRMSEATGMEAKTIHRLLEYKLPEGYQKNADNPLDGDVLILDECSMIDVLLMYNLLKALPSHMTLVMVGDTDQLPSVGAGNVLKDMIASNAVPVVKLERIFRQAQGSRIVMNAHRINKGEPIDMRGGKDSDFFFDPKETGGDIVAEIVKFCTKNLPEYYHVDMWRDIQVLTPMRRGECGAANLNQLLQDAMNPGKPYLMRAGVQYRQRDKVMQIRNDYDKDVFNGDIGTIKTVDLEERELTVDFDGRDVLYDVSELDELSLAYATTIHKSQGSEYPIVVMPVTMGHYVMLQRNLIYTGVTRAKKILVLIGDKKALNHAIRNSKSAERNTKLSERLSGDTYAKRELAVNEENADDNERNAKQRKLEVVSSGTDRKTGEATYTFESPKALKVAEPKNSYLLDGERETGLFGELFGRLAKSDFRSKFKLYLPDRMYVEEKGLDVIRSHARDFVEKRLAPAEIENDGKQTPMRGHPVFIAQHATATCCRECLRKWHNIEAGMKLTEEQQTYIVDVIMEWVRRQM